MERRREGEMKRCKDETMVLRSQGEKVTWRNGDIER